MSIRELIRAGRVDLAEELYEAALALVDATEDEESFKDIDEAENQLFKATNECTTAIAKQRVRELEYTKQRKDAGFRDTYTL